jgi:hypothetical protein
MAKALNVNEAWLMGKDVPMERIDHTVTPLPSPKLREDEEKLLSLYNALNDAGQEKALSDMEDLTQLPKYTEREKLQKA